MDRCVGVRCFFFWGRWRGAHHPVRFSSRRKQSRRLQAQKAGRGAADDARAAFQPLIGLEVHAQLDTARKLFSHAPLSYALEPNHFVAPMDAALPGALPVLNPECVDKAVLLSLSLGGRVNRDSFFERKHYFYPDLPLGYQITQQTRPIGEHGQLKFPAPSSSAALPTPPDGGGLRLQAVGIARVQLEQDTGKRIKDEGRDELIDLNRAGAPLVEIVSEPDLHSAEQAVAFVLSLQKLLRSLAVSRARMERGELRVDVNVSVSKRDGLDGARAAAARVEIKNLNSLRAIRQSIEAEVDQQITAVVEGRPVLPVTKTYSLASRRLAVMRRKEGQTDYRFLPDPDLPRVSLDKARVERMAHLLLPSSAARAHGPRSSQEYLEFLAQLPLPAPVCESLYHLDHTEPYMRALVAAHEGAAAHQSSEPLNQGAKWLLNEIRFHLKASPVWLDRLSVAQFLSFVQLTVRHTPARCKHLLDLFFADKLAHFDDATDDEDGGPVAASCASAHPDSLRSVCRRIVDENPEVVALISQGDARKKRVLMGQFMKFIKETGANFEPRDAKDEFEHIIKKMQ